MELHTEVHSIFPISKILPVIVLFEGFTSIAIEILTIRQLLPFVGGSVIVTSLVIGIFLLFLALGYQYGGKEKAHPNRVLRMNFFIAAAFLGIGLSYVFIEYFFYLTHLIFGHSIIYPLIIYLLLIIAPLIFILGQTVPLIMNVIKQNRTAGSIGGDILSLSTIGSFLGAISTTLLFMYFFGVAWTIIFNVLILSFLSLIFVESNFDFIIQLAILLTGTFFIYQINVQIEKNYFNLTNAYANYQVQEKNHEKTLIINNGLSSRIDNTKHGFQYIELIKRQLFKEMHLCNSEILVLGAGGFTLSAENTFNNRFTYVDIDKQLEKVAIPTFIKEPAGTIVIDDARHYLLTTTKIFKVIVSDTYSDIKTIPAHLLTKEYMFAIKNRLTPDGYAVFNIVASPLLVDHYSKRMDNTIRSVFHNCMVTPVKFGIEHTNIIYICSNSTYVDNSVYSDNLNNSTLDSFA